MQDAPPREAKQIAEAVKFIRAAHADDDQASMDQFSMALRLTVAHLLARRREDLEDKTRPLRGLRDSFRNEWLFLQDYPAGQARLIVSAGDPIAPLEITSNAGQILKIGYGAIECEHLNPGFYRVRLVLPETAPSEMLVEFSGKTTVVRFQPPESPSTRVMAMLSRLNLNRGAFDHMVTDQVSTLLTLAASTGARSESSDGSLSPRNLREPHFRAALRRMFGYGGSDRAAESSLQVLFGIESDARGRTDEYSLRLWSRDEVIPESLDRPVEFSEIKGLGEFVRVTQPGDYWLAVQLRDQKPILLALKLLPRHLTMLIFHVNTKGEARVFQYLLPRLPDQAFDWEMLRRLELVQRFYLSGRLDHAYEFAKDLAMAGEPLTLCLTGYLLLKLGRLEEANRIAAQVIESSGELSDGHVLNAECEASRGKQGAARVSYLAALERGVPIFQDGLVQLFFGAQNHQIAHPLMPLLASMLKNRVRGVIWSAWSPETLDREVFLQQKFASGAEV
jgi:hypothetical protein